MSLIACYNSSSRQDTPTEVDQQTQTSEAIRSIIYEESNLTEDEEEPEKLIEEEDIESDNESNKPPYLQRSQKSGLNEQKQLTQSLLRGATTFIKQSTVKKWHPRKIDNNRWRKINLDNGYGTFYDHKVETVATEDELPVIVSSLREPAEGHLFGGIDCFHMREKSYINRVKQIMPKSPFPGRTERKRFSSHIIQEYKRPLRDIKPNGYGCPRPVSLRQSYESINDIVNSLTKPSIGYNVMPKRQNPEKCDRLNVVACEFCDVLGPGSCGQCIEATNRRISHEVEEAAFPTLDCSATSLVAPSLAQTMSFGDKLMKNISFATMQLTSNKSNLSYALPPIISKRKILPKAPSPTKNLEKLGIRTQMPEKSKVGKKVTLPPITNSHQIDMPPFARRNSNKSQKTPMKVMIT